MVCVNTTVEHKLQSVEAIKTLINSVYTVDESYDIYRLATQVFTRSAVP